MPFWRITPIAEPDDPRWYGDPIWDEVIVRAPLASSARVAAAEMEARLYPYDPIRNHARLEATAFPSSFFDEKLYHVEATTAPPPSSGSDEGGTDMAVISYRLRPTAAAGVSSGARDGDGAMGSGR